MKKSLQLILIFLYPVIAFANGFIVKGNVDGMQTGTVSLAYVNESGNDTILTSSITNGKFTFAGKILEPELVTLSIAEDVSYDIKFFLENAAINIQLVKDAAEKASITGSSANLTFEKLKPGLNNFFAHARENKDAHEQAGLSHNAQALQTADSLWSAQQHQWIQTIRKTLTSNTENYGALYFIQWLLFKPDNLDSILSVFTQLGPTVRNGSAGKKFLADFEHLHRISPGSVAPEINGRDTSGQAVTLAAYRGKVILLDFWASYCGPCRQENKRMLSVYQKYHPEGFEIISLSLDNERPLWVRAIQTDGLPWPQASELRGGAGATGNIYDISDLPRNVLIDRTGKIYAKDIHGADLTEAVEFLLGKRK